MAVFTYEAVGTGGCRVNGLLRADTLRQARDELRDRGLAVSALQNMNVMSGPEEAAGLFFPASRP